jgi:magnesium-transporting ATPase (P-type)
LAEFPFDSDRKRMSLIVRHKQEDKIYLLSKGADSIMIPRIKWSSGGYENEERTRVEESLLTFAKEGLRTLIVA